MLPSLRTTTGSSKSGAHPRFLVCHVNDATLPVRSTDVDALQLEPAQSARPAGLGAHLPDPILELLDVELELAGDDDAVRQARHSVHC